MPVLNMTAADLAKVKNAEPGWYQMTCVKVHPLAEAKSGTSINQKLTFRLDSSSNGQAIPEGKEIDVVFNTALLGKIAPAWEACTGKPLLAGQFDTDEFLNTRCDGKVGQRTFEGQNIDEISMFLPLNKSKEIASFG